ncbi:glycosyl transferase family 90 [Halomonas llamarensis]|uniref:Glycosyl transferase family 90 n=1 Tax=Halomonas llamarensis TaxID=2945104 RepID=A0ABT0SV05_9GAMM|nr:glycosyl transferase family 90 [Halomonas llamarensis]MCL7931408.1 glycosyl transferase family 90 [Halomonas llamarensis]
MLADKWKKNRHKLRFYLQGMAEIGLPRRHYDEKKKTLFESIKMCDNSTRQEISRRVNYYNKLTLSENLPVEAPYIGEFSRGKSWAYYIDMKKYLLAFDPALHFSYLPGDIRTVPDHPTLLKSRPIAGNNAHSVLLKLNRIRHYFFVNDSIPYEQKRSKLVWRGACHRPHRQAFVSQFYDHPLCDIGDSHPKFKDKPWHRGFMTLSEQLQYKFILSIEGNDVATNLKWIMGSNSLCFMTKPKYETWFMEGTLIPGYHYVELASDYSDLEEKLQYYIENPDEANNIVRNANAYLEKFMNTRQEHLIGLLVLQKFFEKTGQAEPVNLELWD